MTRLGARRDWFVLALLILLIAVSSALVRVVVDFLIDNQIRPHKGAGYNKVIRGTHAQELVSIPRDRVPFRVGQFPISVSFKSGDHGRYSPSVHFDNFNLFVPELVFEGVAQWVDSSEVPGRTIVYH